MSYLLLKEIHVTAVVLSLTGFAARGVLMMCDSPWLNARFVRIAPHVIDTVLLVSAIWLAIQIQQYPFVHGWLTAKVLALIAYIVVGAVALRRGRTKTIRVTAFFTALVVF